MSWCYFCVVTLGGMFKNDLCFFDLFHQRQLSYCRKLSRLNAIEVRAAGHAACIPHNIMISRGPILVEQRGDTTAGYIVNTYCDI